VTAGERCFSSTSSNLDGYFCPQGKGGLKEPGVLKPSDISNPAKRLAHIAAEELPALPPPCEDFNKKNITDLKEEKIAKVEALLDDTITIGIRVKANLDGLALSPSAELRCHFVAAEHLGAIPELLHIIFPCLAAGSFFETTDLPDFYETIRIHA